jgi:hypothetical protein
MLEGEISQFLSLLCMNIENFLIFVYGTAFAGITIIALHHDIKRRTKVQSAQLSLELVKRVREKDFAEIVDLIFDNKSAQCDPVTLERFLNHFDMIAKFHEDDLIDIQHITQIYGGLLRRIKTDDHIQQILKKDEALFQPLIRLYNKA